LNLTPGPFRQGLTGLLALGTIAALIASIGVAAWRREVQSSRGEKRLHAHQDGGQP